MARQYNRLTPLAVKRATNPGYLPDGGGLYLVIGKSPTANGGKSWVFRFRQHGRLREMGLGSLQLVSLAEARQRCIEARRKLHDGDDPIELRRATRREKKHAAAQRRTFSEAAAECIANKRCEWRNVKHGQQWENTLATYAFPIFGQWSVEQVDKAAILLAVNGIWTTKTETAARVLGRVRAVLQFAASMGYRPPVDPSLWADVAAVLPKASKLRKAKRQHFAAAPYRQAHEIVGAVRGTTSSPATRRLFEFIVLTAARSGEARAATWGEFDLSTRCWTVPAGRMKAGKLHRVPLSDRCIAILEEMRAARACTARPDPDELVFPAPRGGVLSDMTLTALLRRLSLPYTMHGFRSSFRVWAAEQTTFSREVCEHALAHGIEDETEAAYMRSDLFMRRRELMAAWDAYLATEPATDTADVIPLRAGQSR
ncbi:phage integrase [Caballeronia choica]|uniref:Phage integrase n=1 Tax=Caballeronia choica TaxID=326476 RepID=A0A158KDD4_9BURK|nr:site-specific integrase [Caballeronia choica]SAL79146.1 phage integrase [Caballeronia choica]